MLFKSKKLPSVRLYAKGLLLYDGLLKDLPLKETVILEKSAAFFDDPEPCQIHRSAVRARLTAEIGKELEAPASDDRPGPLLLSYADYDAVDCAVLIK